MSKIRGDRGLEYRWSRGDFQTIRLASGMTSGSVAHELGHALGFRDRYYEIWNEANCEYTEQYNDGDLMSASHDGEVTADEWAELERQYPNKR